MNPPSSPPVMYGHSLNYDPLKDQFLVWGGHMSRFDQGSISSAGYNDQSGHIAILKTNGRRYNQGVKAILLQDIGIRQLTILGTPVCSFSEEMEGIVTWPTPGSSIQKQKIGPGRGQSRLHRPGLLEPRCIALIMRG